MPINDPAGDNQPVITLPSAVTSRVTRGLLQGGAGAFLVQGITAFDLYTFTPDQASWATVALTAIVSFVQNLIEKNKGRRLLGIAV